MLVGIGYSLPLIVPYALNDALVEAMARNAA
jgi:hypothetical protein